MVSGTPDPTRLHPLRPATIAVLRDLAVRPIEHYRVNHGVSERLLREALIWDVRILIDGKPRSMWRITPAGLARLADLDREG